MWKKMTDSVWKDSKRLVFCLCFLLVLIKLYTFEYLLLNMWEILHFNVAILSHTGVIGSEKVLTHINTRTNTNLLQCFLGFHKCTCFLGFFFVNIYLYKNTVGMFYSNVTAVTAIDSNRNKMNPNKICLLYRKLQCESSTKPSCLISINDCKVNFRQIFKRQQVSDIMEVRGIIIIIIPWWNSLLPPHGLKTKEWHYYGRYV